MPEVVIYRTPPARTVSRSSPAGDKGVAFKEVDVSNDEGKARWLFDVTRSARSAGLINGKRRRL